MRGQARGSDVDRQFYTYLHCKPDGTPFYVGKGFGNRALNLTRRRNPFHQAIVAKYGKENIRVFVFECDSEERALSDEIIQIADLRRAGYNLCNQTEGGDGVSNPSPDVRKRIGAGQRGKKRSPEHCKKLSAAIKGRASPPEYCERMASVMRARYSDPAARRRTAEATREALKNPESKRRKSEASKAMWADANYRNRKVDELRASNPKGEKCSWAKLTNADVVSIRNERSQGASLNELAEKYGVSIATVSGIANRRTWKSDQ